VGDSLPSLLIMMESEFIELLFWSDCEAVGRLRCSIGLSPTMSSLVSEDRLFSNKGL
jgi:hypothetical protein